MQAHAPSDMLTQLCCREALLRSAAGPEAFLAMRANFTASLAAVSASSYVAGVGDRHLQVNCKRKKTGVVKRGCTHGLQFKAVLTQQLHCKAHAPCLMPNRSKTNS